VFVVFFCDLCNLGAGSVFHDLLLFRIITHDLFDDRLMYERRLQRSIRRVLAVDEEGLIISVVDLIAVEVATHTCH